MPRARMAHMRKRDREFILEQREDFRAFMREYRLIDDRRHEEWAREFGSPRRPCADITIGKTRSWMRFLPRAGPSAAHSSR